MPPIVADAMVELLSRIASHSGADVSAATEQLLGRTTRDFFELASDYGAAFLVEVRSDHGASVPFSNDAVRTTCEITMPIFATVDASFG
jgi:hypothetical protein